MNLLQMFETWMKDFVLNSKSKVLTDSMYCKTLEITVPIGGSNLEKYQSPGHNLWIYSMKAEVYVDGALKNQYKDACDLITINIVDKKNNVSFASEPVPIWALNEITGTNFPGFRLNEDSNIDFTIAHTSEAWTTEEIKVYLILTGYKIN